MESCNSRRVERALARVVAEIPLDMTALHGILLALVLGCAAANPVAKPASTQCGDWQLAPPGESCHTHCGGLGRTGLSGKICREDYMYQYNSRVDSQSDMNQVMVSLRHPCMAWLPANDSAITPYYIPRPNQTCVSSLGSRGLNSFSCGAVPPSGVRRLCFCLNEECLHREYGNAPLQACRWHPVRKRPCD